ncbi:MAG: Gfo/Idh/MocA family protein [Acetanaerobacterium sp.]
MKKIKIAVLGCGWFGNFHLDHLLCNDKVEVAALVNDVDEVLQRTAKKAPHAHLYHTHMELLAGEPDLDAAVVTIPPAFHGTLEQDLAKRGVHLYVEKPVGVDMALVKQNAQVIRDSGIICCAGYQERYCNAIKEVKAIVDQNKVGLVQGRWMGNAPGAAWWRKRELSGGQVTEQVTHLMDLLRYLFGEAQSVYAMANDGVYPPLENGNAEESSVSIIRFASGTVANIATGRYNDKTKVPSDIGFSIYLPDMRIIYKWNSGMTFLTQTETRFIPFEENHHERSLFTFIDAVQANDKTLLRSPYDDAVKTLRMTMALYRSMDTGVVVPVEEMP